MATVEWRLGIGAQATYSGMARGAATEADAIHSFGVGEQQHYFNSHGKSNGAAEEFSQTLHLRKSVLGM